MDTKAEKALESFQYKERALFLVLLLDILGVGVSFWAANMSGSLTLVARGLLYVCEFISALLAWQSFSKISREISDETKKEFGESERKLNTFSAGFTVFSAIFICILAALNLQSQSIPASSGLNFSAAWSALNILICALLMLNYLFAAKREFSPIIDTAWRVFRRKTWINIMMLIIIGLILTLSQTPLGVNLDSIGAFVLACFLLLLAYSSAAKTSTNLVEATLSERLQNIASGESEEFFNEKMKLFGIFPYNLRGVYYIDFQVKFLDEQNLADVQELSRKIQFNVQLKIPHAVVNVIPVKGE